jgi:NAD+ diphosphatase
MIAFAADYLAGEIRVDDREIESAGWFTKENLPHIPSPVSISRSLIDWWLRSVG